jgi:hypothetical protein
MDEIDSIGSSRIEGNSGGDSEVQRTMLELLNQLDGFESNKNIKVIMVSTFLMMPCSVLAVLIAKLSSRPQMIWYGVFFLSRSLPSLNYFFFLGKIRYSQDPLQKNELKQRN